MKVKDYKELTVWQRGVDLANAVYDATEEFPKQEQYGLISQMRRAAVSIPANIAEGFMRHHTNEYRQHLYVALGSCAELETYIVIARRREYLAEPHVALFTDALSHELRMLRGLIRAL